MDSNVTPYLHFMDRYPATKNYPRKWWNTYHPGVDYDVAPGAPVYAVANGVVVQAQNERNGYGFYALIQHQLPSGEIVYSLYAHLTDLNSVPAKGNLVTKGQVIGYEGASGKGSGGTPHLHFELRKPSAVNPWIGYPFTDATIHNLYDPDVFIPKHA